VPNSRHPLADRDDLTIVHVTHFNRLMWDCGSTRTTVIEHGVPDPGELYRGDAATLGVVINEPVRRWRVTGSDLIARFAAVAPVELFGMKTELLPDRLGLARDRLVVRGDLPTDDLHASLAGCRVYLHPVRWTSLGLSLLEAMHLGMPVVALATTEAYRAVPPEAGFLSADVEELTAGVRILINDPDEAAARGRAARQFALTHFGLGAFLARWTTVLEDAVSHSPRPSLIGIRATERKR
jgi:glycosyltransferase involved in cell wall biosynthesis